MDPSVYFHADSGGITLCMINASIFGWYGFGFDNDPAVCFAHPDNDEIWVSGGKDGFKEVSEDMRKVCQYMFASSLLMIFLLYHAVKFGEGVVQSLLHSIVKLIAVVQFFTVLYGFTLRVAHEGRVCSGDFLELGKSDEGYLTEMGSFWKYLIAIWAGMFALYLAVMLLVIRLSRKQ